MNDDSEEQKIISFISTPELGDSMTNCLYSHIA